MWWLLTVVLVMALAGLLLWLCQQKIGVKWYSALPAFIGLLLLIFTLNNYSASRAEFEHIAASKSLLIFGLPGLGLMLLSAALIWRQTAAGKRSVKAENTGS